MFKEWTDRRAFAVTLDWRENWIIIHSVLLIPVSACWGFNSRNSPGLTSIILSNFKHLFWFSNGKVYFQILLSSETFPAVCARAFLHSRHFYFLHRRAVWHFLYGSQCRSKDSDLISDCDLCFLLRFSHRVQMACVCERDGKEVVCFCFFMHMTVWHITLLEKERLNRGSYFCKYMTPYSYISLAVNLCVHASLIF